MRTSIDKGSKIGPHVLTLGAAGEAALRRAKDEGWTWPIHKNVHIESLALTAKQLDQRTNTLTRIKTPWDDLGSDFGKVDYRELARIAWNFYDAAVPVKAERDAADLKEIINEPDPPGVKGYEELAKFGIELCLEATRRDYRCLLPALNAGTAEWDEIEALIRVGLIDAINDGGHVLAVHEGLLPHSSMAPPWAGVVGLDPDARPIPGAPHVQGAGDMNLRYRYIKAACDRWGKRMPLTIVSEYYAGGTYDLANIEAALGNLIWYDREVRKDPYILGVTPFTFDPDSFWLSQNYNYLLERLMRYMLAEKDVPNIEEPQAMPLPPTIPEFTSQIRVLLDDIDSAAIPVCDVFPRAVVVTQPVLLYTQPGVPYLSSMLRHKDAPVGRRLDISLAEYRGATVWLRVFSTPTLTLWVAYDPERMKILAV